MRPLLFLLLTFFAFAAVHAAEPPHILLREALQYENIGSVQRG